MGKVISAIFILVLGVCIVGAGWFLFTSFKDGMSTSVRIPGAAISPEIEASSSVFTIAQTIDQNGAQADEAQYQPIVNYLSEALQPAGITKVQFAPYEDATDIALAIREGKVDAVMDTAFPAYVINELAGAEPILDRWKGGSEQYDAVIFVTMSSTVKTPRDLIGKVIGFTSPNSTTGYFLPKAELIMQGYSLVELASSSDPVASGSIGYVFAGRDLDSDVTQGIVAAGADSGDQEGGYRFIFTTQDVPRFLVSVRATLDPSVENLFETTLLDMNQSPGGEQALMAFGSTTQFTALTSSDTAYGLVGTLADFVQDEIVQQ